MDARQPRVVEPAKVERARAAAQDGPDAIRRWALRFDLLSDPNRLRLLLAVHAAPEICVSDLAAATGMSDTSVSQALRQPRSHGWVSTRRSGRLVRYALDDPVVHDLLHLLSGPDPAHAP